MNSSADIYKTMKKGMTVKAAVGGALLLTVLLFYTAPSARVISKPQTFLSYAQTGMFDEYVNVTGELAAREQRAYSAIPPVKSGSAGSAVAFVQSRLAELGYYKGAADGIFGAATASAVMQFQKDNSFKTDGVVSADEYRALSKSSPGGAFG